MENDIPEEQQFKDKASRETAFQLYATFCGDVERTAHALGVSPVAVIEVADKCRWNDKLKAILALKRSAAPGDVERAINRALNFVQAHRYRMFLDRVVTRLAGMDTKELESYILVEDYIPSKSEGAGRTARKLSTRALADLASALEKCHASTYQALTDTASDRAKREEVGEGSDSSGAIHAAIARAMSEVGADNSTAAILFDAQTAQAQHSVKPVSPAVVPYDKD